jgi:hypothetical protein
MPNKQPKRGRLWLNDGSWVRLRPERQGRDDRLERLSGAPRQESQTPSDARRRRLSAPHGGDAAVCSDGVLRAFICGVYLGVAEMNRPSGHHFIGEMVRNLAISEPRMGVNSK